MSSILLSKPPEFIMYEGLTVLSRGLLFHSYGASYFVGGATNARDNGS